jgi:putative hemolysin
MNEREGFVEVTMDGGVSVPQGSVAVLVAGTALAFLVSFFCSLTQAAYLSKQNAADIMVPVAQITFLSSDQTLPQAIVTAHLDPHTRFPVIQKGNRDDVLGYINFKELVYRVRTNPAEPTLHGVIRPVRFVPPDMPCHQVLRAFVDEHEHMALVRDDRGRTLGLITLEDVVEVLLGDLQDEFDRLPKMCHSLPKGVWIVGGGVPMAELAERLGMPALATEGTLSAWMTTRLGERLVVDQRLRVEPLEFTVRRIRRGKPFEVLISPVSPPLGS